MEDHLEFLWVPCMEHDLEEANLQPWVLQKALEDLDREGTLPCFLSTL
jgi:hypothetical protein